MGSGMNYSKGRQAMKRMSDGKAKALAQNVIIKDGRGRYPKCLKILPYQWCPKKEEVMQSKFYFEHFAQKAREERIKRMQEMGLPTRIEG
jgi:hypothetical protein